MPSCRGYSLSAPAHPRLTSGLQVTRPLGEKTLGGAKPTQMGQHSVSLVKRIEGFFPRLLADPERARRLYPALLLLFTLIVWFPALFAGLDQPSQDAFYHITHAALHHTPEDVTSWFVRGYWAYTHYEYRPLTRLSLLADYLIWGPRPLGFHLTNVLLHFACVFLLGAVMVRAGSPVWAARLAGAVAAVFPPGQMAVSWMNGRQDVLCAALLLAGVLFFVNWLVGRSWPHLLAAAVFTLLSALAKEPGAAAPLFMLAAAFLVPTRRRLWQRIGATALIAALLIPYVWLRLRAWPLDQYAQQNANQLRPLNTALRWFVSDLLAPRPYDLATTWRRQGLYLLFSRDLLSLLIEQLAFWAALIVLLARQRRLLGLGVIWKLVFFLPVYNLYWNPAFTHYRYLPHLGTAWLVGLAAWELTRYAATNLRRPGRALIREALIAAALLILIAHYVVQLPLRWPTWSVIAQGGPEPHPSFCRALDGHDVPFRLDEPRQPPEP
ncbi:MAG: hypothetical protein JSV79_02735 [Armatimonadota bacterium]|nr:MAG: hypothetical protein JSV79_02735 [Armatimonadota bacterium]